MLLNKIKSKNRKKLISNFFSLLSIQGINYILPLITLPYLFRVLGVEKFGLISFALSVVTFLKVITDYGFHISATREISLYRSDKKKLIEIYSNVMSVKILLVVFGLILLYILTLIIDIFADHKELFYLSYLFVIGNSLFPIWFFQGIEEMKYIGYLNIIAKLFFTIGVFTFIHSPSDYLYYPILNGLGFVFIGIFSIYFIKKKYDINFRFQSINEVYLTAKDGYDVFLTEFFPNIYNNFATFLLGLISSMENVGYYSLATQVIGVFNNLLYITRNVFFPFLNINFSKFKKVAVIMIITGGTLSLIIFSTSYSLVPYIFGEKAYSSIDAIHILALSPLMLSITFTYGNNKLLIMKKDKEFRNITIKSSIFGFFLSLVLITSYGIVGAAITVMITRTLTSYLVFKQGRLL